MSFGAINGMETIGEKTITRAVSSSYWATSPQEAECDQANEEEPHGSPIPSPQHLKQLVQTPHCRAICDLIVGFQVQPSALFSAQADVPASPQQPYSRSSGSLQSSLGRLSPSGCAVLEDLENLCGINSA